MAEPYQDLVSAEQELSLAFDRARATGYRTGSEPMRELAQAEQRYTQVRQQVREASPGMRGGRVVDLREDAPYPVTPNPDGPVVDLRDDAAGLRGAPAVDWHTSG